MKERALHPALSVLTELLLCLNLGRMTTDTIAAELEYDVGIY
jgi:hypothetical protein